MMRTGFHFQEIFKPLFFLTQILCLAPYTIKNKRIIISKIRLILSVILVAANVALTVIYFKNLNETLNTDFAKAGTIKFLSIFRDLGSTAVMVVNVAFSYGHSKRLLAELDKIYQVDKELAELGLEDNINKANASLKRNLKILLVLVHLIFITFGETGSALLKEHERVMYLLVNLYPRLIIGFLNITVYMVSMLIEGRFKIINLLFTRKMIESNQLRKYPIEFDFCDKIKHLVSLHKVLVKVSKEINSNFSFQVLLCITMNFILLIGDLHTIMYIIFFGLFTKHSRIVFDILKHCIGYIFDLFYIAKRSADLCEEANRTKVLLLGIKIDVEKEDERNLVIASTLKLMQNKLEITACKLFNIDNALLFSICSAASSYLFIMLQLDMGNKQNPTEAPMGVDNTTLIF
ncbi:7tm 7 domain containing protein, partial [Asbolus verrucosus]